jgi:hypothetical protein
MTLDPGHAIGRSTASLRTEVEMIEPTGAETMALIRDGAERDHGADAD